MWYGKGYQTSIYFPQKTTAPLLPLNRAKSYSSAGSPLVTLSHHTPLHPLAHCLPRVTPLLSFIPFCCKCKPITNPRTDARPEYRAEIPISSHFRLSTSYAVNANSFQRPADNLRPRELRRRGKGGVTEGGRSILLSCRSELSLSLVFSFFFSLKKRTLYWHSPLSHLPVAQLEKGEPSSI